VIKNVNSYEGPQVIALKALTFLVSNEDHLDGFLASSGMDLQDLKELADDETMLAGLLDHILQNESLLLEFSQSIDYKPEMIVKARYALPGANHDA
jgi:Protein of unknown function (DUF3572)